MITPPVGQFAEEVEEQAVGVAVLVEAGLEVLGVAEQVA